MGESRRSPHENRDRGLKRIEVQAHHFGVRAIGLDLIATGQVPGERGSRVASLAEDEPVAFVHFVGGEHTSERVVEVHVHTCLVQNELWREIGEQGGQIRLSPFTRAPAHAQSA